METTIIQTSFSTVMMAVLTTNVFLILLTLCLVSRKLLVRAGYKLLAIFAAFTALRFLLPIELPFAFTLRLPRMISRLIVKCHERLFDFAGQPLSLWQIFKGIWLAGFLITVAIQIFSYFRYSRHIVLYGKELTDKEPYKRLIEDICLSRKRKNRFRVIALPDLDTPALFGILHPRILLPEEYELTDKQLFYILRHETAHHFNHDILLKGIVKIITLAYWWDPFSWLLNRQADVILEMHVDDTLTTRNTDTTIEYMQCLVDISERTSGRHSADNLMVGFLLPSGLEDLKRRFGLITNNQEKHSLLWTFFLLAVSFGIYIASYTVILEGYIPPQEIVNLDLLLPDELPQVENIIFPTADNSYFIDNQDGTYTLYLDGKTWDTVDSLKHYPEGIPVYTLDNLSR